MIKTLANGVKIVFEKNENIRSATLGIWVKNGTRHEPEEIMGVSHFIEHMMFKGTEKRSAKQISYDLDSIGGQMNAFTTKECTCYYIKALDIHLERGIEIICDMFFNSTFDKQEVDLERTVIEEEIGMYDDQPEDVCVETLAESVYRTAKLSYPVLGTKESLKNINSEVLHDFVSSNYVAENTVISITGSFSDEHLNKIYEIFGKMQKKPVPTTDNAVYLPKSTFIKKDINQNHICIGFEGCSTTDKNRYTLQILNGILGAGMSSRLFQKVREENGLCYSISSFNMASTDTGVYAIYLATSKSTEKKALELTKEVLNDFVQNGITDEELAIQREQIKANILMGLESSTSRMHFLARSVMFHNQILTADEIIARYDVVTKEDVQALAKTVIDFSKMSICVVGDIEGDYV